MEVLRSRADLARLDEVRAAGPLTFVPTMGALHAGHLSLVEAASAIGPVVVSIFVNPTQFGPGEDFERYPRDLESDLALLEPVAPAVVFSPPVEVVYPRAEGTRVTAGPRADVLCGARRPGHFDGVTTVVAKLFNLVRPDVAVFGRKDAQQVLVLDAMVRDLGMDVHLVDAPTVREPDGLAMSSRNRYLEGEARERALCLRRALQAARRALAEGERDVAAVEDLMALHLAPADAVDYAEVRAVPDLEVPAVAAGRLLLAIAAQVGGARLIDNLVLEVDDDRVTDVALLEGER